MHADEKTLYYKTLGANIRKYREAANLSLEMLGEKIGKTKKTIQRYETGEIRISSERLVDIAAALNIPVRLLSEGAERFLGFEELNSEIVNVPIVGRVSCGRGVFVIEEIERGEPVPKSWLNGGQYFFTRAQGDSMSGARIQNGDLVLIRRQPEVEDGEIAAIVIDEQVFLKRIFKRNGMIILQSENTAYPPIVADPKKCFIVGKMKKIIISN